MLKLFDSCIQKNDDHLCVLLGRASTLQIPNNCSHISSTSSHCNY